jgi:hypothetical protein
MKQQKENAWHAVKRDKIEEVDIRARRGARRGIQGVRRCQG